MKRRGRTISYMLVALLAVSFWTAGLGFADDVDDKKNQLGGINNEIGDVKDDLNAGRQEAKTLAAQIEQLERQINEKEQELDKIQENISSTKRQINEAQQELTRVQEEMVEQNDNMNERLRAMYKNGDTGMIEVLLGSADLSDLVSNIDMVSRIYDSDTEVLEAMQQTYDKIEEQKKQLENLKSQLQKQEEDVKARQKEMEADRQVIAEKKSEIDKDNKELEAMLNDLQAEANALTEEIRRLQSTGTTYEGGIMAWPAPGNTRVTSEFGYRLHPVLKYNKLHTGMDIGAATGSTVVAAADGTVIKSAYNGSYGEMIMIDHGGGIVTLYAHNSKRLVNVGDKVTRGQTIARSGATGRVTGPHVHFEVRVNGDYKNPRDYL